MSRLLTLGTLRSGGRARGRFGECRSSFVTGERIIALSVVRIIVGREKYPIPPGRLTIAHLDTSVRGPGSTADVTCHCIRSSSPSWNMAG
jgi:hypothetical protein